MMQAYSVVIVWQYRRPLWTYSCRLQRVVILLQLVVDITTTRVVSHSLVALATRGITCHINWTISTTHCRQEIRLSL